MPDMTFWDQLVCIGSASFQLEYRNELSRMAGGNPRVADLGPELWLTRIQTTDLLREEFLQADAEFNKLRGSLNTFLAYPPYSWYPQKDKLGVALGSAAVQIHAVGGDNKSLRLKGLPAGYVLTKGDFLSFIHGTTKYALHQLTTGATADGGGITPLFEVAPHLRAGVAVDLNVTLVRPHCEMMVLPKTYEPRTTRPPYSQISLQAVQVL
jgi:hypothetical protein